MDDEAKQLLREIRDIGLRNESRLERDLAFRKRVLILAVIVLIAALGALGYLLHLADSTAEPAGDRRPAAGQAM
jgi:hypothetical protein